MESATGPKLQLSKLARHSTIYSIAPLAQRFLSLLLVPIFTAPDALKPAQWGVLQLTDLLIVATTQIAGVNLLAGMVRYYFEHKDLRDRNAVISSTTLFLMALSWIVVGIALLFHEPLSHLLFATSDPDLATENLPRILIVALLIIPLALTTESGFRFLLIHQRSGLVTTLRITKTLFELGLKIYLIVFAGMGIMGFLLAVLVGEVLASTLLTGWVLTQTRLRISWRVLKPVLIYTLPLVFVGLFQMSLHQLDRLLLRQLSPEDVAMTWTGIYGMGYMIGFLVQNVVVGSFMQIWQPYIFGVTDPQERSEQLSRVSTYALLLIAAASLGVMAFGRELVFMLSGQASYHDAFRVAPWITAAYAFFGLNALAQVPLFAAKKTLPMTWINAAALVINIGLNLALIPRYGFQGAACATLITFVCLAGMGLAVSSRVLLVPFELGRMVSIMLIVLAGMAAVLWADDKYSSAAETTLNFMTGVKALTLAAALGLLWLGVLRRSERASLTSWLGARLGSAGRGRAGD
jgi:O-antigen/teichoic acid export membrane protein